MSEPVIKTLTKYELDQLPDGTSIKVTWSGGNGPHKYVLRRHFSIPWAAMPDGHMVGHLKHIGAYPLDQVFVDRLTKGET